MKKQLLALLLTSYFSQAQIVLTDLGLNQPNDTIAAYAGDTLHYLPGNAGANQTWDFSAIAIQPPVFSTLKSPNPSMAGYSLYPTANIATLTLKQIGNGQIAVDSGTIGYGYVDATSFDLLGTYTTVPGSGYAALKYTPAEKVIQIPFHYQDIQPYSVTGTTDYSGALTSYRTLNGTLTYDAYGKVIFPGSSLPVNAARLKRLEIVRDSLLEDAMAGFDTTYVITTYETTEYTFFTDSDHRNISFISTKITSETHSSFFPEPIVQTQTKKSVLYETTGSKKQILSGLDDDFIQNGVYRVFPNPTKGTLYLADPSKVETASIYTSAGQLIQQSSHFDPINLNVDPGMYVLKVGYINGKEKYFKIIKE
jgi:hypothetical protein